MSHCEVCGNVYCENYNCVCGELKAENERLKDAEQKWVDQVAHYRNLAIMLGAKSEQMNTDYDIELVERDEQIYKALAYYANQKFWQRGHKCENCNELIDDVHGWMVAEQALKGGDE